MIKQYFTQAWAQLRQQPLISAVSIAGTALAIFLIMLVVMMQQVKVAPFAPESNRDRLRASMEGVGSVTLSGRARQADISKGGIGGVNTRNLKIGE